MQERGNGGYLEKDGYRIMIDQWEIRDDGSLTLISSDEAIYKMDKKLQDNNLNPIFVASNTPWHLTRETRIVLLRPESTKTDVSPKGKETIVLEDTECDVNAESAQGVTRVHFNGISSWEFRSHNP